MEDREIIDLYFQRNEKAIEVTSEECVYDTWLRLVACTVVIVGAVAFLQNFGGDLYGGLNSGNDGASQESILDKEQLQECVVLFSETSIFTESKEITVSIVDGKYVIENISENEVKLQLVYEGETEEAPKFMMGDGTELEETVVLPKRESLVVTVVYSE